MADKKFRSFAGTLYPDSESYDCETLLSIIRSKFIDWAYILHDKDVDENGELKKLHIHWVGRATPRCLSVVSNFLGLPENDIVVVKNFDNMVMYLIHLNDIDKFQYSPDDVESNLPNIGQLLRRQSEGQIVKASKQGSLPNVEKKSQEEVRTNRGSSHTRQPLTL